MKIFALLLSLFFMVLTMVPCNDAAKGMGDKACLAQDVHLEQSEDTHTDLCTPFCVCNCCGMSLAVSQIKKLLPEKSFLSMKADFIESKYNYSLLFNTGIWQPPKWC